MVLFMCFLTLVAAIHPANNTEHVDQLVATKLQLKIKGAPPFHRRIANIKATHQAGRSPIFDGNHWFDA